MGREVGERRGSWGSGKVWHLYGTRLWGVGNGKWTRNASTGCLEMASDPYIKRSQARQKLASVSLGADPMQWSHYYFPTVY